PGHRLHQVTAQGPDAEPGGRHAAAGVAQASPAGDEGGAEVMDSTATGTPRLEAPVPPPARPDPVDYLNHSYSLSSGLWTLDHKRICILYLVSISVAFVLGGIFAAGIRLELMTPKGDMFTSDTYNKLFSMHGIMMLFFFLIPSIPATL